MVTNLQLKNFKIWQDTGKVALKPVTLLLGTNSSGKSSLIQSLLLLKQTVQSPDRKIHLNLGGDESNHLFNFGDFDNILFQGARRRQFHIGLEFKWTDEKASVNESSYSCTFTTDSKGTVVADELVLSSGVHSFKSKRGERDAYQLFYSDSSRVLGKGRDLTPERSLFFPMVAASKFGENSQFLQDLSLAIYRQFEGIVYLGPLRRKPERDYVWNKATPSEMGNDGHRAIDILLSSSLSRNEGHKEVFQGVSDWLKRMDVAEKLEVGQLGRSRYELAVYRNGVRTNLRDVGIGISQVLPVLTAVFFAPRESIIVLEEPEIHLHPLAQSVLADLFVEVSRNRGIQLLVETHSEHLFRRMQTLLAQASVTTDEIAMYFVERNGKKASLRTLEVDEFGKVKNWPQYFFGDVLGETRKQVEARLQRMESQNRG